MTEISGSRLIFIGPYLPSRQLAKLLDSKRYLTGVCCVNGHFSPRSTHDGKCLICKCQSWERVRRSKGKSIFLPNASKLAAHELNQKYFQGDPCPDGHDGLRWTHNGACVHCTNSASREFRRTDEGKNYIRKWRISNVTKVRNYNRNSKAKRKGAEGRHTAEDVAEILRKQKFKCAECGISIRERSSRHVDHIMPIALGGSNWPSNLQVLCVTCNLQKSDQHPSVFARSKGRLV